MAQRGSRKRDKTTAMIEAFFDAKTPQDMTHTLEVLFRLLDAGRNAGHGLALTTLAQILNDLMETTDPISNKPAHYGRLISDPRFAKHYYECYIRITEAPEARQEEFYCDITRSNYMMWMFRLPALKGEERQAFYSNLAKVVKAEHMIPLFHVVRKYSEAFPEFVHTTILALSLQKEELDKFCQSVMVRYVLPYLECKDKRKLNDKRQAAGCILGSFQGVMVSIVPPALFRSCGMAEVFALIVQTYFSHENFFDTDYNPLTSPNLGEDVEETVNHRDFTETYVNILVEMVHWTRGMAVKPYQA